MNEHHRTALSAWWAFAVLILPVIYVLSIGPVFKCRWSHSALSGRLFAPLARLATHYRQADEFMSWYVYDFWRAPRSEYLIIQTRLDRNTDICRGRFLFLGIHRYQTVVQTASR